MGISPKFPSKKESKVENHEFNHFSKSLKGNDGNLTY